MQVVVQPRQIDLVVNERVAALTIQPNAVEISTDGRTIQVSPRGIQGPGGGIRYTHTQAVASATWTVNHLLGLRPQIEVFNAGGVSVEPAILHIDGNQAIISFNTPQTGIAVCN
jgi:hypothetical protein